MTRRTTSDDEIASPSLASFGSSAASLLSCMVLLFAMGSSARAAVVATDIVDEGVSSYTLSGDKIEYWRSSPSYGLTALAGTSYDTFGNSNTKAYSGTASLAGGFGPSILVSAGTYTLTVYAGEADLGRRSFTTFNALLATTGGTELPGKTVLKPYVDPATPDTPEWVETVVRYEVPSDSPLIGQPFTWGFSWSKTAGDTGIYAAWDAASVDFTPNMLGTCLIVR